MALQKQPVNINFAQGVDTKTDPNQLPMGKFLALSNSVFDTTGRLTKRPGFPILTKLPNTDQTTLTTLNSNLLATGSNLYAYNQQNDTWHNQGTIQPVDLSVKSVIRNSYSQTGSDMAIASNGLACIVYNQNGGGYYSIIDTITGQPIVTAQLLDATATNPRVFLLDKYFIITFTATVSLSSHLRYISIPIVLPTSPNTVQDISSTIPSLDIGYDAVIANNNLYVAYQNAGGDINIKSLSSTLVLSAAEVLVGQTADLMSVSADFSTPTPTIWLVYWDSVSTDGYATAYDDHLNVVLAPTQVINNEDVLRITSIADNSRATIIYEIDNTYASPYPNPGVQSNYIQQVTITDTGTVGVMDIVVKSLGLASKPFFDNDTIYFIGTYGETNQPTYFLVNITGQVYARFAYSNGGGYKTSQVLPTVSMVDGQWFVPYEVKDFLATVNKNTDISPAPSTVNAIYTQTGINLLVFSINTYGQYSAEIANTLHLTGGQLWEYDGVKSVEHGFHVWPENVAAVASTSTGTIAAGTYYYQFCYEWTDNQGNIHRSAPSIPLKVELTGPDNTITLYVPTLRITFKTNIRIVGYRWSVAQQTYYQFTSIINPTLNSPNLDYVTIVDTEPDASILGQTILYTTGGVVENIAAPSFDAITLFKNRLFGINAENPNELWYSKQVIQNTPVEMSDLLTLYVAPTTGTQGSTGPAKCLSAMDDKLIIFKDTAIYYMTGLGPDNTGANNDFTDPIYITSSVGCSNPNSIVLMPLGIMFQSNKGIWLLGRDLSTKYIGDGVAAYNDIEVTSALVIPGTNQVRMTLANSTTLVYDYYVNQWATFSNQQAIAAVLYEDKHTYLNRFGQILQQSPDSYLDGAKPVLMSFTTGWINLAGLQGYERFYFMHLLGTYKSPFKLNVEITYDYNPNTRQSIIVTPDNYSAKWGGDALWGSSTPWGGPANTFEVRIFPKIQKCEAFQITITEIYDQTYGVTAGAGLTLSGINLTIGAKKGYRTNKASQSFG